MSCRVCHGFPLGRGKERSRYTRSLELIRDTATHGCESCSLLTTGVVPLLSSLGYSNEDIEKCRVGFFIPNKNTRRGAKGVCVWLQKPRRHFAVEIYTDNGMATHMSLNRQRKTDQLERSTGSKIPLHPNCNTCVFSAYT